jgi:NAD(P)-dependent dehydrogenase (short-subunit alcohol dehydrogenase family)
MALDDGVRELGRVDIVVANAGIGPGGDATDRTSSGTRSSTST